MSEWYKEGIPIEFPHQTLTINASITSPNDGLVYLLKYVAGAKPSAQPQEEIINGEEEKKEEYIDMKSAFEQRFGKHWLLEKDAKTVLLALLAETGKNYDISKYGQFVLDADFATVKEQLQSWGIPEDLI